MRRAGCGLAILGVLLSAGSLVVFGSSIFRALAAHEVVAAPLTPGAQWASGPLTVDSAKFSQVAVRGLVRSTHARRGSGDDGDWDLEYAFPFSYTVFDAQGRILAQESKDFASDGSAHTMTRERVTEDGGSAQLEQGFAKFAVPPPGAIRVEAELGDDVDYGATIESPQVAVYDNVSKHAKRLGVGVGLLVVGGGLAMLGAVLLIVAAARGGQS